eukprot:scaffold5174_cov118-Isochrysis_galbana.AAC.6
MLELARLLPWCAAVRVAETRICSCGEQSHDRIWVAVPRSYMQRSCTARADDVHHIGTGADEAPNRIDVAVMASLEKLPAPWVGRPLGRLGICTTTVALPSHAGLA